MNEPMKRIAQVSERNSDYHSIRPFQELPDGVDKNRIGAHDLFSMFTANIIKKQTKFVR
jgi:hypothetical protein